MGSALGCFRGENSDDELRSSNCSFCLQWSIEPFINMYDSMFQRGHQTRIAPLRISVPTRTSTGTGTDAELDTYQSPPRPLAYDDPRCSHGQLALLHRASKASPPGAHNKHFPLSRASLASPAGSHTEAGSLRASKASPAGSQRDVGEFGQLARAPAGSNKDVGECGQLARANEGSPAGGHGQLARANEGSPAGARGQLALQRCDSKASPAGGNKDVGGCGQVARANEGSPAGGRKEGQLAVRRASEESPAGSGKEGGEIGTGKGESWYGAGFEEDLVPVGDFDDEYYYYYYSESEENDCPICLEEYTEENPKMELQCNHDFHLSCIYEWMERSEACPVCGKVMLFDENV